MAAILIVDNEPLIREMLMLVLERSGFAVVSAANGIQGLRKYHLYQDDIELVICDVAIPEMNGTMLVERLSAEQPNLPIIVMSDERDTGDLGSQPNLRFLPKPFDLTTLLSTVNSLVSDGKTLSAS
jgi:DNA-binding NtrC family response regulator